MAESIISPIFVFMQNNLLLVGLTIILIAVAIVIYLYYTKTEKEDKFKEITFEDTTLDNLDKLFKLHKSKIRAGLFRGHDYIGDIESYIKVKGIFKPLEMDEKADQYIESTDKKDFKPYEIMIFRVWKTNIIMKLLNIGKKEYVLVDSNHIMNVDKNKNNKIWNIKADIQFIRFGGNFITSDAGKEFLSDISIKFSHENTLTYMQNFTRKAIYLELQHTKNMTAYEKKKKVDQDAWNRYKESKGYTEAGDGDE